MDVTVIDQSTGEEVSGVTPDPEIAQAVLSIVQLALYGVPRATLEVLAEKTKVYLMECHGEDEALAQDYADEMLAVYDTTHEHVAKMELIKSQAVGDIEGTRLVVS